MPFFNSILRLGDEGAKVSELQAGLHSLNLLTDPPDGFFGHDTLQALVAFQVANHLVADGQCGPITWSRIFPDKARAAVVAADNAGARISLFHQHFVETALSLINVREDEGPNHGVMVDRILKASGLDPGEPWCQAFVNFCSQFAATGLHVPDPTEPHVGAVLLMVSRMGINGNLIDKFSARRGDVFWQNHGGGKGHTGIILLYANGLFHTVEGNTGPEGGRDGDGVYAKARKYNEVAGVYRLPEPQA